MGPGMLHDERRDRVAPAGRLLLATLAVTIVLILLAGWLL